MHPIQIPITGQEKMEDLADPIQVLTQFYAAFNNRDLDMLSDNWEHSQDTAMDNPLGGIKRGWQEIKSVYEKIVNGSAKVYVEFYDYTLHQYDQVFYAVGRERGSFSKGDQTIELKIRTSRIFRLINGQWKQVHHHGSIEDPELLKHYQAMVLGI